MRNPLILVVLFVFAGCTVYQYVPNSQPVPLFSQKHDLSTNIATNPLGAVRANVAYAFSDHIGSFCDANYYQRKYGPNEFLIGETGCFLQSKIMDFTGAIGYYNHFKHYHYEIFTGIGYGTNHYENIFFLHKDEIKLGSDSLFFSSRMFNLFIQPDISFKLKNYFEMALSTRLSLNNYILTDQSKSKVIKNNNYQDCIISYNYFQGRNSINIFIIEPGLTFREGNRFVKVQEQIIIPVFLSNHEVFYSPFGLYLSMFINIAEIFHIH
jgi:hypothetical protein